MAGSYPLTPKSNKSLRPGDFWAIPLIDGSFACGRVLQLPTTQFAGSSRQFLGALMDWHGQERPNSASLVGTGALDQGQMHLMSITRVGGCILGNRDLALEAIAPDLFINGTEIQRGYDYVRVSSSASDLRLPSWPWWSFDMIWKIANRRFLGLQPPPDTEPMVNHG